MVVPTFRRPARLRLLLEGLAGQRAAPPWDLVVVDNDPEGSARPVVTSVALDVPTLALHEHRIGSSHARNTGIVAARGRVTAMIDDDVVPEPWWLARLTAPLLDGRCELAGGRVVLDPAVPRPRWLDEAVVGQYLTAFDLGAEPRTLRSDEYVVTASAAAATALLRAGGGFDIRLGPRGRTQLVADDVQLVRSLRAQGARARWVPDAVVVHELPPTRLRMGWMLERAYWQGRSDWLLDAEELATRRLGGAHVALDWLRDQVGRRLREGATRPDVAFHLACDLARTAGRAREAVALVRARPR